MKMTIFKLQYSNREYQLILITDQIDFSNSNDKEKLNELKESKLHNFIIFNQDNYLCGKLSQDSDFKLLIITRSKNIGGFYFYTLNLNFENILEENNYLTPKFFSYFNSYGNLESIVNLNILGIFFNNTNNDKSYKMFISLRITFSRNKFQIYVIDEIITSENEDVEYDNFLTTDVFEFFEYLQRHYQNDNIQEAMNKYENTFHKELNKLFKSELYMFTDLQNYLFEPEKSLAGAYKFDSYLAYLIISNNYLSIKNYLSILDPKREEYPYLSNEKLFFTIRTIFEILVIQIADKLKENNLDTEFFNNKKLLEVLIILSKLLYVNKSRAEISIFKPYRLEDEILIENSITISKSIEEIECLILIVKIFKYYSYKTKEIASADISAFNTNKFDYFQVIISLIFPDAEKNILTEIKLFYIKYLNLIRNRRKEDQESLFNYTIQQKELNTILKNSLYTSKFILFFVYAYFSVYLSAIKITGNNKSLNFGLYENESKFITQIKLDLINSFSEDLVSEIEQPFPH